MGLFAVDFRGTARNWWVYWSVIGHRLKVGATDPEGQGAGAVQMVWTRVEMWERGHQMVMERRRRIWCGAVPSIGATADR